MTDRDELFTDLMAGGIDPLTAAVVADSECEQAEPKPRRPQTRQPNTLLWQLCLLIAVAIVVVAYLR